MNKNNIKGSLILLLASLLWGLAFVVQRDASNKIKPFAFNGLRSLLGAVVIMLFLLVKKKVDKKPIFTLTKEYIKNAIKGGVICGTALLISVNLQQYGIAVYENGVAAEARSGFLTALYVILVPIASLVLKKRVPVLVWIAVIIATVGIYFLCLTGGFTSIYLGDVLMFSCALTFTVHIMAIDAFCEKVGGPQLSVFQFTFCGIISIILSFVFEGGFSPSTVYSALPQILYMGVFSSGAAYTLQIVGQKYAEPAIASISMSFESVFAALGAVVIVGTVPKPREILGCVLVFVAIITAQIPEFLKKDN